MDICLPLCSENSKITSKFDDPTGNKKLHYPLRYTLPHTYLYKRLVWGDNIANVLYVRDSTYEIYDIHTQNAEKNIFSILYFKSTSTYVLEVFLR